MHKCQMLWDMITICSHLYMKVDGQHSLLGDHEHLEEQGGVRTPLVLCCY